MDLKRLLLKCVFENITLTEGVISYKLRFPFNEFVKVTNPDDNKPLPYEPMESLADKDVEANDNENIQSGYMQFCEPKIMLKKQEVALKNATSLSSGWRGHAICELIYIAKHYCFLNVFYVFQIWDDCFRIKI